MANIDRNVAGAAVELTLNGTMTSGTPTDSQTFQLNGDVAGWPATWGVVLLDPDGSQEKILYSNRTGNTFTVAIGGRGFDGTAAAGHGSTTKARHILDADLVAKLIAHVNNTALDQHSQYYRKGVAEGVALEPNGNAMDVKVNNATMVITADEIGVKNAGIATAQLADGAVTAPKLAAATVVTTSIVDGSVTLLKLADFAVGTAKLVDGSVTSAKIADGTIVLGDLATALRGVSLCTASTHPASPAKGDLAYETDTGELIQYQGATTGWTPPWNTAWGTLAYRTQTVSSPGMPAADAVFSLMQPGAITFPGNRRVRLRAWFGAWFNTTVGGSFVFSIKEGATTLGQAKSTAAIAANAVCPMPVEANITPSAGSHTYTVAGANPTAVGNTTAEASATEPAYFIIEDLGPSGPPP